MRNYLDLMADINENGVDLPDRTGVGRRKVFGRQMRFKMSDGFPLVTTRFIPIKHNIHELLWIIKGSTSVTDLHENNVRIWDKWAVSEEHILNFVDRKMSESTQEEKNIIIEQLKMTSLNDLGSIYGEAWRNAPCATFNPLFPTIEMGDIAPDRLSEIGRIYEQQKHMMFSLPNGESIPFSLVLQALHYRGIDQLQELIINLKTQPFSSRLIINAWIPEYLPFEGISPQDNVLIGRAALPPCHLLQQYIVLPPKQEGGKLRLSLQMYQRSLDLPVGGPWNIAQYSLLLMMIAQVVDMEADEFIWTIGDAHCYFDQFERNNPNLIEGIETQLKREPRALPKMIINPEVKSIFDFKISDFELQGYDPHPKINYPVAL